MSEYIPEGGDSSGGLIVGYSRPDPPAPRETVPVIWTRDPIRRNASCPCGSGKKFKHCCIAYGNPRRQAR